MPEMHLRKPAALDKPGFTYRVCRALLKTQKKIQKLKKL